MNRFFSVLSHSDCEWEKNMNWEKKGSLYKKSWRVNIIFNSKCYDKIKLKNMFFHEYYERLKKKLGFKSNADIIEG